MVEELAASASSLNDQVGRVHSAIRVFRLMPQDKSLAEVSAVDLRKQQRELPAQVSAPESAPAKVTALRPKLPKPPKTPPKAEVKRTTDGIAHVDADAWQSF